MNREETIKYLLSNPEELLQKRPFFRGSESCFSDDVSQGISTRLINKHRVSLPRARGSIVTQDKFLKELDPMCHEILFDKNVPTITMKLNDGTQNEIKFEKTAIALQQQIANSHTIYLCGNPMNITLRGNNPIDRDQNNYALLKEYWADRNMDGWRTKAVYAQKTTGDCGLLFYYDYKNRVKCRLISYPEYVICSHNDKNGDRLLETLYYADSSGIEHIDSYDDKYKYSMHTASEGEVTEDGWVRETPTEHGFDEIPLVTKRGDVAWNTAQSLINLYEIIYNIFFVIQKRHGYGTIFIRGSVSSQLKRIAGNVVLQDSSLDGNGDVKVIDPPSVQGMLESLQDLFEKIQINSSCTFLLPKDIRSSGDISALAITLTRDLDLKNAQKGVIEWQNFADKMMRLFKYGLSKELVNSGENYNAFTEFGKLRVSCRFNIWQPFSKTDYNNMLISMKNGGLISEKTAVEKNTESEPDEAQRLALEKEKLAKTSQREPDNDFNEKQAMRE